MSPLKWCTDFLPVSETSVQVFKNCSPLPQKNILPPGYTTACKGFAGPLPIEEPADKDPVQVYLYEGGLFLD